MIHLMTSYVLLHSFIFNCILISDRMILLTLRYGLDPYPPALRVDVGWSPMFDWRHTTFLQLRTGAKCTVQMLLDSCQPVTSYILQERVRNNLTSSFQSTVFKALPWVLKMVPIVMDNTTQMQQTLLLIRPVLSI